MLPSSSYVLMNRLTVAINSSTRASPGAGVQRIPDAAFDMLLQEHHTQPLQRRTRRSDLREDVDAVLRRTRPCARGPRTWPSILCRRETSAVLSLRYGCSHALFAPGRLGVYPLDPQLHGSVAAPVCKEKLTFPRVPTRYGGRGYIFVQRSSVLHATAHRECCFVMQSNSPWKLNAL